MTVTDDDVTTIAERLPENFVDKLAEKEGGYRTKIDLDWPEDAPTAGNEFEDLIEVYSPQTGEKPGPFTAQLKKMMDDVAEDAEQARDYIEEGLGSSSSLSLSPPYWERRYLYKLPPRVPVGT